MRLIDVDSLEQQLDERWKALTQSWGDYDHYANGFCGAMEYVEQAPTIDAVEVVRCKDCALRDTAACTMTYDFLTGEPLKDRSFSDDDDFCSYGERRDDDAEE